jgi:2-polyprenyl-6-methoxyphenol hydroxylase-like FAD-dependent oxidoreductase
MPELDETYDVLVAGAGVAGVAAAVAAARAGRRTALVEKTVLVGGLATSGLIFSYTPLCDGHGRQVTFGIAEELLHMSYRYGPGGVPPDWPAGEGRRCGTRFSPAAFALALDELLLASDVELWLDTLACAPLMNGARVAGVEVETKAGRGVLRAACTVDATGDADLAHRAGAPCEEAENWLSLWALGASLEKARQATEGDTGDPLLSLVSVGASNTGDGHPEGTRTFRGTDARDVTEFVLAGRALLRERYARLQAERGRENVFPLALPAMAQFRTTRRIAGRALLSDGMAGRRFKDAVGLVANWWRRGEVWEVPYGALVPQGVGGLLAAGRCISAEGEAWEVTRVIHGAAHTGQIAGVAAALCVERGTEPGDLDADGLRKALGERGLACRLDDVADAR